MKTLCEIILLASLIFSLSAGQFKVTSVKKIEVPAAQNWNCPRFSPDGKSFFVTNTTFSGIWKYNLQNDSLQMITQERSSGLNFIVSADGNQVTYLRNKETAVAGERTSEIVTTNLTTKSSQILSSGKNLSAPVLVDSKVVYAKGSVVQNIGKTSLQDTLSLVGIENTKIILIKNGSRVVFDPLINGNYIWPSLSPDKKKLVAYEVDCGTFICDVEGNTIVKLGRLDAPSWTRDGKWIVYMNDKDDGYSIVASDIYAVSVDGTKKIQLTNTADIIEMNPSCSMSENKILVNASSGEVYLLTYEVAP